MNMGWHQQAVVLLMVLLSSLLSGESASAVLSHHKKNSDVVRWDEEHPGCTFSQSDDGKDVYGMWTGDVAVITAVDTQELEKVSRRHEPFFGVLLTFRYRGQGSLNVQIENISLEFVKHFRVVKTSLDPDDFSDLIQNDTDILNHQAAREIQKHPEKKTEQEAYVRAFLKDSTELLEFVGKNSLRPTRLSPGYDEVSGWVLFSTKSKWIGEWKRQEEFILRVPIEGKILEFPFKLPPKPGERLLRKRE